MSKKIAYTLRGFDCHGKPMTETITMHKYNLWERFVRWCKRSRFRHINTISSMTPDIAAIPTTSPPIWCISRRGCMITAILVIQRCRIRQVWKATYGSISCCGPMTNPRHKIFYKGDRVLIDPTRAHRYAGRIGMLLFEERRGSWMWRVRLDSGAEEWVEPSKLVSLKYIDQFLKDKFNEHRSPR